MYITPRNPKPVSVPVSGSVVHPEQRPPPPVANLEAVLATHLEAVLAMHLEATLWVLLVFISEQRPKTSPISVAPKTSKCSEPRDGPIEVSTKLARSWVRHIAGNANALA